MRRSLLAGVLALGPVPATGGSPTKVGTLLVCKVPEIHPLQR
jgi:hypothetical protein